MRERRLTKLFVRYRERGDVDALTAVFDATAGRLHALARHLVRPGGDAEDVLQATFLAAIEHAGRYDPEQPLEPWLTGILVRKARQTNASTARRPAAESTSPAVSSDPREHASLAEFDEALRGALAAMPERYRRVLQPFLEGDEKPREIARRHAIAPGTVRVQIHRGLEMLRRALPAGYGLGGMAVVLSDPRWARMRTQVEGAARTKALAGGATTASVGSAAASLGGGTPLAVGAMLVALAGGGAYWASEKEPTPQAVVDATAHVADNAARESVPAQASAPRRDPEVAAGEPRNARALPSARLQPSEVAGWSILANVRGLEPAPPEGLPLRLWWPGPDGDEELRQVVELRADGALEIPLEHFAPASSRDLRIRLSVESGEYAAFQRHVGRWSVRDGARGVFEIDVDLERVRSGISGRIQLVDGRDPTSAYVGFYPEDSEGNPSDTRSTTARCDHDGMFSFSVTPARGFVAGIAPGTSPWGRALDLTHPRRVDLETIRPEAEATIEGIAYFDGLSLERSGEVIAHHPGAWSSGTRVRLMDVELGIVDGEAVVAEARAVARQPDGHFRLEGLSAGDYDVLFLPDVDAGGSYDVDLHGVRVRAPARGLELDSPLRVYAYRVTCEGRPVPDVRLHRYSRGGGRTSASTRVDGTHGFFTTASRPGTERVVLEKPGYRERTLQVSHSDFDADRTLRIELERSEAASGLAIELTGLAHGRIGPLRVRMQRDDGWKLYREGTSAGAVFELGELPVGGYELRVEPRYDPARAPGEQSLWLGHSVRVDCRAGAVARATLAPAQGGRVVFRVRGRERAREARWRLSGPDGKVRFDLCSWSPDEGRSRILQPDEIDNDGAYWLTPTLAAGRYELSLEKHTATGLDSSRYGFSVTAGRVTDVHVH